MAERVRLLTEFAVFDRDRMRFDRDRMRIEYAVLERVHLPAPKGIRTDPRIAGFNRKFETWEDANEFKEYLEDEQINRYERYLHAKSLSFDDLGKVYGGNEPIYGWLQNWRCRYWYVVERRTTPWRESQPV